MWRLCLSAAAAILTLLPPAVSGAHVAEPAFDGIGDCSRTPAMLDHALQAGRARAAAILQAHPETPVPPASRAVFARLTGTAPARSGSAPTLLGYQSDRLMGTVVSSGALLVSSAAWTGATALPDDELAALFAHELAHLERGDVARALCETLLLAGDGIDGTRAARGVLMRRIARGDLALALHLQLANHARELAADAHAIKLLVAAGYEGTAMVRLLQKLAREGSGNASFTHPPMDHRLDQAKAAASRAGR